MIIENERYLRACSLYVEYNPVETGLVKKASQWPYSSSGFYEKGKCDELIDRYEWDGVLPVVEGKEDRFF